MRLFEKLFKKKLCESKKERIILNLEHPILWENNDDEIIVVKKINFPGPITQYRFAIYEGNAYWCPDHNGFITSPFYVQLEDSPEKLISLYDDIEFIRVTN